MTVKINFPSITYLALFLVTSTFSLSAQAEKKLLSSSDEWIEERIDFPFSFAPKLKYEGYEELRFKKNWNDSTSQDFWTYVIVWEIESVGEWDEKRISEAVDIYYDGLMGLDAPDLTEEMKSKKTISLFLPYKDGYRGKIMTYDGFFTRQPLTFYATINAHSCPDTNKDIIRYEISPQPFTHPIWDSFSEIVINSPCVSNEP